MKPPKCYSDNPDTSRFYGNCTALLAEETRSLDSLKETPAWLDKYLGPLKR